MPYLMPQRPGAQTPQAVAPAFKLDEEQARLLIYSFGMDPAAALAAMAKSGDSFFKRETDAGILTFSAGRGGMVVAFMAEGHVSVPLARLSGSEKSWSWTFMDEETRQVLRAVVGADTFWDLEAQKAILELSGTGSAETAREALRRFLEKTPKI